MLVASVRFELFLADCHSLKQKRAVVRPIVEGARRRFQVASAEVDMHDKWQRTTIGMAVVGNTHDHVVDVLDQVERFVWSFPEVQVLSSHRSWLEEADS